jgi:hypothetical protein
LDLSIWNKLELEIVEEKKEDLVHTKKKMVSILADLMNLAKGEVN